MTSHRTENRIKAIVEEQLGIRWADFHDALMPELTAKLRRRGIDFEMDRHPKFSADDLRELAREVTVGETYFFREVAQLETLAAVVVPEFLRKNGNRPVRILSAGCSSGEEAYSIALALQEHWGPLSMAQISVTGIDVNPTAIAKARRARYSEWSLRATPPQIRERHFRKEGKEYCLSDELRAKVHFEERNLLGDDHPLWVPHSFDVIFCRNVIIYFSADSIRALVARFADALVPGGVLFMGHSETLDKISDDFERQYLHGAFCYVRKALPGEGPNWTKNVAFDDIVPADEELAPSTTTWVKLIGDAAQRVQQLVDEGDKPDGLDQPEEKAPFNVDSKDAPPEGERFSRALRLFHEERFNEALAMLRHSTSDLEETLQSKLLRASILCQRGDVAKAKTVCLEILGADPKNSGAHHVLALCRKHEGDAAGAISHDYDAVLADPNFAIAHLHLGILLRRAGNWGAASSALSRALNILPRETDERILLFGEGFRREALMFLCRAEIHNLGRRA